MAIRAPDGANKYVQRAQFTAGATNSMPHPSHASHFMMWAHNLPLVNGEKLWLGKVVFFFGTKNTLDDTFC